MARFKSARRDGRESLHILIDGGIKDRLWRQYREAQAMRARVGLPERPLGEYVGRMMDACLRDRASEYWDGVWLRAEVAALRREGWDDAAIERATRRLAEYRAPAAGMEGC